MSNYNADLTTELKLKLSEFKMLNNTFVEAIERKSDDNVIEEIVNMINDKSKEINSIRTEIDANGCAKSNNDNATYSFYDSIKKENEKNEENDYETQVQMHNELLDSISEVYESSVRRNRFLVSFGNGISSLIVKEVSFGSLSSKRLIVKISDSLDENGRPIIEKVIMENKPFDIIISYLTPTGSPLYSEHYHNCMVNDIFRTSLDYHSDDFGQIELVIGFSNVTYETSN